MKSVMLGFLMSAVIWFMVASCATVTTEPLATGEMRLLNIQIPMKENIKVNFPFVVNINFEANGKPEIRTACFSFSGDGPHCFKETDVNYGSPGRVRVQVRAKTSGSYALESYVYYLKDGKVQVTNVVHGQIRVVP